jgi:lysine 2,3-aminomutase
MIRFHTRVPVADPGRVTAALGEALSTGTKPVYTVIHINHPQELTPETDAAFARLRRAGCLLLSQSVLLKDINNNVEALATLFQGLAERGVKPYYLHHPDLAPGTGHFRVSIEEGQALIKGLRGHISGLAMPVYVLDIPGGFGKVPVGPCHIHKNDNGYDIEDIHGQHHDYP